MKKRITLMYIVILAAALVLTACGSKGSMMSEPAADTSAAPSADYLSDGMDGYYEGGYAYDNATAERAEVFEEAVAAEEPVEGTQAGGAGQENIRETTGKKLIKTVNMQVETQEFDILVSNLRTEVEALGGYVEKFTSSNYNEGVSRDAYMEARVPAELLDGFLQRVAGQSNVVFQDETVEDVTLQYVDLDTHKKSLITEQSRLLELLEKAENVEDLIEIESRLSEVRYQIESLEAQLRTIDNQVTYSTVCLSVREVKLYTPAAEESIWQRISSGFESNVYNLLWWLEDFVVDCIINLPFLLIWIVLLILFLIVLRLFLKMLRKKIEKKVSTARANRKRKLEEMRMRQEEGTDYEIIPTTDEQRERAVTEEKALQETDPTDQKESGEEQNG